MPLVESVDYETRRIHLSLETADAEVDTVDVYREVRALRRTNEAHRRYPPMLVAGGNVEKVAGKTYTQPYAVLLRGCRLVPYNASHFLVVTRDTFTDDGFAGRDCFDRTPLADSVEVDIDFVIHEVEVRLIQAGSGLDNDQAAQLRELWRLAGLDADHPLLVTATQRTAGTIQQSIAEAIGTVTVTRQ
jgi:hypothetical protein